MEYNSIFAPLLIICLSLLGGIIIGGIVTFYMMSKDQKDTLEELDKFRKLYFEKVKEWKDKYVDDDPCDRFKNNN